MGEISIIYNRKLNIPEILAKRDNSYHIGFKIPIKLRNYGLFIMLEMNTECSKVKKLTAD
jgi:hypothetical protein